MKSTRYRPRGKAAIDNPAELRMRHAVRDALRSLHGPSTKPPGPGWLIAPTGNDCGLCGHPVAQVVVPTLEATVVLYCAGCEHAFALTREDALRVEWLHLPTPALYAAVEQT